MVSQPVDAGVPRHVADIVAALGPEAYAVDVVCPRSSTLWAELAERPGVTLHPMAPGRTPSFGDVRPWLEMVGLARRADVVHAHSAKAGFLGRVAAAVAGRRRRCVFTPHAWSFLGFDGWRRRLYVAVERLAARWCRVIVAVSAAERDAGLAHRVGRPAQYRVVPNGVDLARFAAAWAPEAGRIVMVSRLADQKRPLLAVEALAALPSHLDHARLVVVGEGPLEAAMVSCAEGLGVRDRLDLLGRRSDVPDQLARAGCLLLTSSYEGCPLSVLEAMAAGVPVVATASGGTAEVVRDGVTGLLVGDDPREIAEALEAVLADGTRAATMGARAREEARRHSLEEMVRRTLDVYAEVDR
jgi:glycosyltransferase involved in cell wall biosynthesis